MPFQPGQSGNPSGRPATIGIVRTLARENTEKAIRALVDALDDEDARVRIAAANSVLDRGWGKPAQAIVGGEEGDPAINMALRVLFGRD